VANFGARNKESFMKKQQLDKHQGLDPDFSEAGTGRFRASLQISQ
jgi:hypothetical protein